MVTLHEPSDYKKGKRKKRPASSNDSQVVLVLPAHSCKQDDRDYSLELARNMRLMFPWNRQVSGEPFDCVMRQVNGQTLLVYGNETPGQAVDAWLASFT